MALAEIAEDFGMTTKVTHSTSTSFTTPRQRNCAGGRVGGTVAMILALCVTGCANPMLTRLPSFYSSNPQVEGYEFQRQDPFPDPDIAPDGGSRPPDFQRPRTESRKAAEQRLFQGMQQLPQTIPRGAPLSGQRHPATVM